MRWIASDGGRAAAGHRPAPGDCVTRAIAIATGMPYSQVYITMLAAAEQERYSKRDARPSHPRTGMHTRTYRRYLTKLGWTWIPRVFVGVGCKSHLRDGEIPMDKTLLVEVSRHLVAVKDGVIYDTHDPSRGGTRCVYGYWLAPE